MIDYSLKFVLFPLISVFLLGCGPSEDNPASNPGYPSNLQATSATATELEGTWFMQYYDTNGQCYGVRLQFEGDLYWYDIGLGCTPADYGDYVPARGGWIEFQGHTNTLQGLATQFTFIASAGENDIVKDGNEMTFYNIFIIVDGAPDVLYLGNDPVVRVGEINTTEGNRPASLVTSQPYYRISDNIF